jgi:hypothetical protein
LIAPGLIIHFHNYFICFPEKLKNHSEAVPPAPPKQSRYQSGIFFSSEVLHGIQSKQHMEEGEEVVVLYYYQL